MKHGFEPRPGLNRIETILWQL